MLILYTRNVRLKSGLKACRITAALQMERWTKLNADYLMKY